MSTPTPEPQDDEPELERLLGSALDKIDSTRYPNVEIPFLDALRSEDRNVWWGAVTQLQELTAGIKDAIVRDSRFPGEQVRMMRSGLGGGSGFYPNFIDQLLVRRAAHSGSAEKAIQWLQKILTTSDATGRLILTLWGVPVESDIQLTDGVKIVLVERLPESEQKQIVIEHAYGGGRRMPTSALDFAAPKSALVIERRVTPLTYDGCATPQHDDHISTYELLREIALVLTIDGPRVSLPGMLWFTFDDSDFNVWPSSMNPLMEIMPTQFGDYPNLDPVEAPQMVRAYLALPAGTRQHVRVAIERISQAQRRRSVGDRAVELATALEALVGDGANNEMTHKVKVRTVRLVGGSRDERIVNAAIINKTYSIRSKLVHTGRIDENATDAIAGSRFTVSQIVDRGLSLCVQLTKKIIMRGEIPDWSLFDITEQPGSSA
ncbi:HEPN domain-containing protein [Paraburkholderia lacunae]|uniref:Uncharacterized protein n=1 Tax=Paraburkholderia lacunae TaxID=2211104 RepID=A0A370NFV1_9BURK|nr:HEPN domain-containing protein [Paraburkholderia lacunae]RDK04479.1 hypothetical protein DLM46_00975 [Paraburkholderia lacunae]